MDGDHRPLMLTSMQDEPSTIDSFDESGYRQDSAESSQRPVALESRVPNHLLLVSLLESLVEAYEKDPTRRRKMFRIMCKHLDDMNVIPSWDFIENFSAIRVQYTEIVQSIMIAVSKMMDKQAPSKFMSLPSTAEERSFALLSADNNPLSPRTPNIRTEEVLKGHNSRYKTEFREIEKIGKGGFGSVYKAKNTLDQREYAVKKIILKQKHPESARKVLREVQLLASLDHTNIVGYNAAWIEAEPVAPSKAQIWTLPTEEFRSTEVRFTRSNSHEGISQSPPNILTNPVIQSPPTNTSTLTATPNIRPSNVHSQKKQSTPESTTKTPQTVVKAPPAKRFYQQPGEVFQPRRVNFSAHNLFMQDLNSKSFMAPSIKELDSESECVVEMGASKYGENGNSESKKGEKSSESDPSKSSDSLENLLNSNGMCGSFRNPSKSKNTTENSCMEWTSTCEFEESVRSDFKVTSSRQEKDEEDSDMSDLSIRFENSTQVETSSLRTSEHVTTSQVQSEKVDIKRLSKKHGVETSVKMESRTEIRNSSMEVLPRNASNITVYNGALLPGCFGYCNLLKKSIRERLKETVDVKRDMAHRQKQLRRRAVSFDPSSEFSRGEMGMGRVSGELFPGLVVTLYIQMQLCSRTLAGWLKERNESAASLPVSFDVVNVANNMHIFEGIMKGVQYIHSNGFMHRDLKPKNIFLDGDNLQVRIGDFGLARHDVVDQSKSTFDQNLPLTPLDCTNHNWDFSSSCSLHTSGVGTATYASPEQLNGSDYDSKSDMFSAGIILFELFHPFSTGMERARCMGDLRKGRIASEVRKRWPLQSAMMEVLLSSESKDRPSADDVLRDELFVSKDEMISRLQTQLSDQTKLLRQKVQELTERTAELRDARQSLKEKNALLLELSQQGRAPKT